MERLDLWWSLAGPSAFVAGVTKAVSEHRRVVCIGVPDPAPANLDRAIEKEPARRAFARLHFPRLGTFDQSKPLPHVLGAPLGVPAVEVGSVSDFAWHPKLADQVVIVRGLDRRELRRWALFLRHLSSEDSGETLVGPILIVLLPTNLTYEATVELRGTGARLSSKGSSIATTQRVTHR